MEIKVFLTNFYYSAIQTDNGCTCESPCSSVVARTGFRRLNSEAIKTSNPMDQAQLLRQLQTTNTDTSSQSLTPTSSSSPSPSATRASTPVATPASGNGTKTCDVSPLCDGAKLTDYYAVYLSRDTANSVGFYYDTCNKPKTTVSTPALKYCDIVSLFIIFLFLSSPRSGLHLPTYFLC